MSNFPVVLLTAEGDVIPNVCSSRMTSDDFRVILERMHPPQQLDRIVLDATNWEYVPTSRCWVNKDYEAYLDV